MLSAEVEIFPHAHFAEQFARFRTLHEAAAGDLRRAGAAQFLAVADDLAGIGQEAGNGVEQRGFSGAVEADDGNEFTLMNMDRDVFERLRLAVVHADVLDLQQRHLVLEAGFRPRRGFQGAAEIDAPHGFVAHHLLGLAGDDLLAEVHREHAIDQGRDALDVVVDQHHRAAFVAEAADQFGERSDFCQRQSGERLVDQHDLGIAGDRLGEFEPPQVREGQGRRPAVHHRAEADALGDLLGALKERLVGEEHEQAVGQQARP